MSMSQLPVVQELAVADVARKQQNCVACPHQEFCWNQSPAETVLALLACRIQAKVRANSAMKLLLRLLHGKLKKYVQAWPKNEAAEVSAELDTLVLETVLKGKNVLRGVALIPWLFHKDLGTLKRWTQRRLRSKRRGGRYFFVPDMEALSAGRRSGGHSGHYLGDQVIDREALIVQPVEESPLAGHLEKLRGLVEDGLTLTTLEYRVLRFCLTHATPRSATTETSVPLLLAAPKVSAHNRHLHLHLSEVAGIRRNRVSRVYAQAQRKIITAMGAGVRAAYLARLGLPHTPVSRDASNRLTAESIVHVLELAARPGVTVLDVSFATGVLDTYIPALRRRFGGMTVVEVRSVLTASRRKVAA